MVSAMFREKLPEIIVYLNMQFLCLRLNAGNQSLDPARFYRCCHELNDSSLSGFLRPVQRKDQSP